MLFGHHGVGKSLLAVRLAEALARGRPIPGLAMPTTRRNVLYVDLVLSDDQFAWRYSREGRKGHQLYRFSANLYRDHPDDGEDLIEWLRGVVEREKVKVVVIDDLSMVSRTDGGTRETLKLVRELRRMSRRMGISVLVLADSQPFVHLCEDDERELRRRRILCAYADSVFALSALRGSPLYHLVQTRSQAGEIAWPRTSPAHFRLTTGDDGLVGLDFVEVEMTEPQRRLVCRVKQLHDREAEPMSFRGIAEHLGISKTTAARLYGRWRPSLERGSADGSRPPQPPPEVNGTVEFSREDLERYDFDPDGQVVNSQPNADRRNDPMQAPRPQAPVPFVPQWHLVPLAAALARRSIHDLERVHDEDGNEIFVESREEHTGRPKVWYRHQERTGNYRRYQRDGWGTSGRVHGLSPLLPRHRPVFLQVYRSALATVVTGNSRAKVSCRNL